MGDALNLEVIIASVRDVERLDRIFFGSCGRRSYFMPPPTSMCR